MTPGLPLPNAALAARQLAAVLNGEAGPEAMVRAAEALVPGTEGIVLADLPQGAPVHLFDSFAEPGARSAVQRYINGTYILNPVWNAIQGGLAPGIYRVVDLAPWAHPATDAGVQMDDREELGFRTPGWPRGRVEVSMLTALPAGVTGELSLSRRAAEGGFSDRMLEVLSAFSPLFDVAFLALWSRQSGSLPAGRALVRLDDFGCDRLSPREAAIVRMILKGHSNISIGLALDINVTTVKTHRKNAYAKLGISTQQELFHEFLVWLDDPRATAGNG